MVRPVASFGYYFHAHHQPISCPTLDRTLHRGICHDDGICVLGHRLAAVDHTQGSHIRRGHGVDSRRIWFLCRQLQHLQHFPADAVLGRHHPRQMRHTLYRSAGYRHDVWRSVSQLLCRCFHYAHHTSRHAFHPLRTCALEHEDTGACGLSGVWPLWGGMRHHRHHRVEDCNEMVYRP